MIKLIASDMDGTVLRNGAQELPDGFTDLILRLKDCGVHFVAASGRQYQNLRRLFGPIQNEISYIAENGSLCTHEGKVFYQGEIDHSLGLEIIKEIKKIPELEIALACERTTYVEHKNPEFLRYLREEVKYDITPVDDFSSVTDPFLKIAVCDFQGSSRHDSHFRELFKDRINVVTSGNLWFDFIAPNANKGLALQSLMDQLHVKKRECMAFGDEYNDVEMLLTAGSSYAMKTCAPGVDRFATATTATVEEVLEELLEEYE